MKNTCINLKERFGRQFKIEYDESYEAERPEFRAQEEVWLQQISCEKGHIDAYGGEFLEACTNTRGPTAAKLMKLPFIDHDRSMDGDDGVNAVFHVEHFDEVARIMKPRRRRRLSAEQRQAATERLKAYQFPARQSSGAGLERTETVPADSQSMPAEHVNPNLVPPQAT